MDVISIKIDSIIKPLKYCDVYCPVCITRMTLFKECSICGNYISIPIKSRQLCSVDNPVIYYEDIPYQTVACKILENVTVYCFNYGDMFYLIDKNNVLFLAEYYSGAWLMGYSCIPRTAPQLDSLSMPCWNIDISGYSYPGHIYKKDDSYILYSNDEYHTIIPECGKHIMEQNRFAIIKLPEIINSDINVSITSADILELVHYVSANCCKDLCIISRDKYISVDYDCIQIPDNEVIYAWVVMPDYTVQSMIKMNLYHAINDIRKVKHILKYSKDIDITNNDNILSYGYSIIMSAIYDPIYVITRFATAYISDYIYGSCLRMQCTEVECQFKYENSRITSFTSITFTFNVKNSFPIAYNFERSDNNKADSMNGNYIMIIKDLVEDSAAKICNRFTCEQAFIHLKDCIMKEHYSEYDILCIHSMHTALEKYRKTENALNICISSVYCIHKADIISIKTNYIVGIYETKKEYNYIYKYKHNLGKTLVIICNIIIANIIGDNVAL